MIILGHVNADARRYRVLADALVGGAIVDVGEQKWPSSAPQEPTYRADTAVDGTRKDVILITPSLLEPVEDAAIHKCMVFPVCSPAELRISMRAAGNLTSVKVPHSLAQLYLDGHAPEVRRAQIRETLAGMDRRSADRALELAKLQGRRRVNKMWKVIFGILEDTCFAVARRYKDVTSSDSKRCRGRREYAWEPMAVMSFAEVG